MLEYEQITPEIIKEVLNQIGVEEVVLVEGNEYAFSGSYKRSDKYYNSKGFVYVTFLKKIKVNKLNLESYNCTALLNGEEIILYDSSLEYLEKSVAINNSINITSKGDVLYCYQNRVYSRRGRILSAIPKLYKIGTINENLIGKKIKLKKNIDIIGFYKKNKCFGLCYNKEYIFSQKEVIHLINDNCFVNDSSTLYTLPFDELYELDITSPLLKEGDTVKMIKHDKSVIGLRVGGEYITSKIIQCGGSFLVKVTDGNKSYTSNIKNFKKTCRKE
jgi:hypothetical protein